MGLQKPASLFVTTINGNPGNIPKKIDDGTCTVALLVLARYKGSQSLLSSLFVGRGLFRAAAIFRLSSSDPRGGCPCSGMLPLR